MFSSQAFSQSAFSPSAFSFEPAVVVPDTPVGSQGGGGKRYARRTYRPGDLEDYSWVYRPTTEETTSEASETEQHEAETDRVESYEQPAGEDVESVSIDSVSPIALKSAQGTVTDPVVRGIEIETAEQRQAQAALLAQAILARAEAIRLAEYEKARIAAEIELSARIAQDEEEALLLLLA